MSRVKLAGISVQVKAMNIRQGSISALTAGKPWLARAFKLGMRQDDGSKFFEMTTLSGNRVVGSYTATPDVQDSDNSVLASLYRKRITTVYSVSGEGLPYEDLTTLYAKYRATQLLYLKQNVLKEQLNHQDITASKIADIILQLDTLDFDAQKFSLEIQSMPTVQVMFAEGNSCQVSNWVVAEYADFSFELVQEEYMEV